MVIENCFYKDYAKVAVSIRTVLISATVLICYMIPNPLKIKFTLTALLLFFLSTAPVAFAKHILIYGDSLSAAYGMDLEEGWAHLLAQSLDPDYTVTNASISGDTSAAGLARLPITLAEFKPDLVILELGANDGLQGLPIKHLRNNLTAMIDLTLQSGSQLVLVGISLPASYGPRYIDQFRSTYTELAEQYQLPFIDFYREDFFDQAGYIQEDGLHPTEITQPIVRDLLLDFLRSKELVQ